MTKKQAEQQFKNEVLPAIKRHYESDGIIDKPARRTAWNDFTDMLCKDGQITDHQYNNWSHPAMLLKW
jgi:hypothetical protein